MGFALCPERLAGWLEPGKLGVSLCFYLHVCDNEFPGNHGYGMIVGDWGWGNVCRWIGRVRACDQLDFFATVLAFIFHWNVVISL